MDTSTESAVKEGLSPIVVRNLGKCYCIYEKPTDRLKRMLGLRSRHQDFWALSDVSFQVKAGEVVGIVGRNGSGKSTLLQIIAGTLAPTTGEAKVEGRVAAILELGSGFNPEFTGRENVFLNGMLLGATREEVAESLSDIQAFAEIGTYFDQPVKTYSSGMLVRLAFAVLCFIEKDILIVDEALAVGDELFQRKCFGAIERFREKGGTVLFVSHAGQMVVQLCDRALLLHRGQLLLEGSAKVVIDYYHKLIYSPAGAEEKLLLALKSLPISAPPEPVTQDGKVPTESHEAASCGTAVPQESYFDPNLKSLSPMYYENRGVSVLNFAIRDQQGNPVNVLQPRRKYFWTYEVLFNNPASHVKFGMLVKTASGMELGGATETLDTKGSENVQPHMRIRVSFAFSTLLAPGIYFLNAGVMGQQDGEEHYLARCIDAGVFRVLAEETRSLSGGVVDFLVESQLEVFR